MFAERGQKIVNRLIGRDPNSLELKKCTWKLRFLYAGLCASFLATIFWLVAVCANHWVYWEIQPGGVRITTEDSDVYLEAQHAGMWQVCKMKRNINATRRFRYCSQIDFYPTQEEIRKDDENDHETDDPTVLNYRRAITAIAIIGLIVMATAGAFTWYSIVEARYIFKRLAGCLQIGNAACIFVCIEIYGGMLNHEQGQLRSRYPPKSVHKFGFCYWLSWISFTIFIVVSIILFFNSHKQKDKRSEDNPIIIGRV